MRRQRGFTLLEMLTTATVLLILASAVVPMAKNGVRRQKELELHRCLRTMREAIDLYKADVDSKKIKSPPLENNGYPETLEILVEGAPVIGKNMKIRYLRSIPLDPLTGQATWGLRSLTDDPSSTSWSGNSVFDVYSLSPGSGMNGVPYKDW